MSTPETTKAQSPAVVEKKQEKSSLVELKNGKVYFRQKPLSLEKQSETLQEIVKFRDMLEERIKSSKPPLTCIPEEHKPLIAKLGHESDKTLPALSKHIHQELLPTLDEEDGTDITNVTTTALPFSAVEKAIEEVLTRNNYGLDASFAAKIPAAVCVWRWETRAEHIDWLPKNSKDKAETRRLERVQAKKDLTDLFEALTKEERDAILDPKGANKLPAKELNKPQGSQSSDTTRADESKTVPQSTKKQGKKKAEEVENDKQSESSKPSRPKKAQDPEKIAKEKERLEKKAARLEKERKEKDAHNKSQSLMAKFFVKPTKTVSRPTAVQESAVAGPSTIRSEFEKTFKPFVLQKDKTLAPSNWFLAEKKQLRRAATRTPGKKDIILVDSEEDDSDIEMLDPPVSETVLKSMSAEARLKDVLSTLPPSTSASRPRSAGQIKRERGLKVYHPVSVRDLMSQLSEAEISGNDDLVREIIAKLSDRKLLPAKAFCFHTDARPGYFGTWTRSSRIIGPRTPFEKDSLVFDYAYDSGEEWEEEPAGEDVVDDGEEEDGDADEQDSDLDSWLVDDDDEPDLELLGRASPPPLFDGPHMPPPKRKAEDSANKVEKKRKVVVPLVPFVKGPVFETTIGQCPYEPFRPYAIRLLNDTPLSIDPFTFVSSCLEDYKARHVIKATEPHDTQNQPVFAIPALPPHLTASKASAEPFDVSTNKLNTPKKAPATSKAAFPVIYMDLLLAKIAQLQASSITSLVESIYLDLREFKVKKVAIEAKVREVGEKCKDRKVWVVKPNFQLLNQTSVS